MPHELVTSGAAGLALVLSLSFLIGLEREGRRAAAPSGIFGGVRTFPLIGLLGFALAKVSDQGPLPATVGFVVVGAFLLLALHHKQNTAPRGQGVGITSEISALLVYVVGVLVEQDFFWLACTLAVACLLLLELKGALEALSHRMPRDEILNLAQFLVLSAVLLPVVPNEPLTSFHLNPFRIWLTVVAVTAVSYGSYALQRLRKDTGVLASAVLGGAYSSTVATITLARRAKDAQQPALFSGAMLVASAVMYVRLTVLIGFFNRPLLRLLGPAFLGLAAVAAIAGTLWSRRSPSTVATAAPPPRNPLELSAALAFGAIFVVMIVVTQLALSHLGKGGVVALSAIMGASDVDPYVLGLTQAAGEGTTLELAATAITIAAASNNLIKGLYARGFSDSKTGTQGLLALAGLAALGLLPLLLL